MSECIKCNKPKISPEQRCDCRLEWQMEKCFNQSEKIAQLESSLAEKDELLREALEVIGLVSEMDSNTMFTTVAKARLKAREFLSRYKGEE